MSDGLDTLHSEEALSRRERDQRRREHDIVAAAHRLITDEGFSTFSMERLAEATGYSRAAIYYYFPCKEEVVIALAIEATRRRIELSRLVAGFEARPRERFVALGESNVVLYPDLFNMEMLSYTRAFRDRTSDARRRQLEDLEMVGYELGADVVRDAVGSGDLELPAGMTPEEFVFGLWIVVVGTFGARVTVEPLERLGIDDLVHPMRRFAKTMMDGFGWRPLSTEWDYRATMKRIYTELFTPVVIDRIKRF